MTLQTHDPYTCNFSFEVHRAKRMSIDALEFNIEDARACIKNGINEGKYFDQIAIYSQELKRRRKK